MLLATRAVVSHMLLAAVLAACGSSNGSAPASVTGAATQSSSLSVSPDGRTLYVANADTDSVSVIDLAARALTGELLLATAPPAPDPTTGAYAPSVQPRAVAISPDGKTLYVSGERSSAVHVVDLASRTTKATIAVGSEPVGLVLSRDGASLFVACSQDATVVKIDTAHARVVATAHVPTEPWALALSANGSELLATHLMGPGITAIDAGAMTVRATWSIPDVAGRGDPRLAHGAVRGLYAVAPRPGTSEIWVAHALLATDTAQPALDFETTAFASLSIVDESGGVAQTLSINAQDVPGINGAFADVISGPHAVAFTKDGAYALMVDANSEDVLVVDAARRVEAGLVRPLPGAMPEGIALSPDGATAYVDERISGDVAVLKLDASSGTLTVAVDGPPIARLETDPMPAHLRLGQRLFNSANSSAFPITTDHWVACATCHMEGRSDAVTWRFVEGPRDTPTNAGGMLGTGFLFRTADRTSVQGYWRTIALEQGGRFDAVLQAPLLDALADYVNFGIPLPIPPTTDPALAARGKLVFAQSGCGTCHAGVRFTDSGQGNASLDLAGPVNLHDVGTCVVGGDFPDMPHTDDDGHPRGPCAFDTPSLSGVASTPPYLHDGSAPTLKDAIGRMPGAPTSADDLSALVEYLRSL